MNKILKYITPRNLIVTTLVLLFSFLFLNTLYHPVSILTIKRLSDGHTILNLLPFYNATIGYEYLQAYTSEAIIIYKRILIFDLIILIPAYVLFFIMGLGYYGRKVLINKKRTLLSILVLPLIAAFLNIIEDIAIWYMINSLPEHLDGLMGISGIITITKLIIFIICFTLIIVFFILSKFKRN